MRSYTWDETRRVGDDGEMKMDAVLRRAGYTVVNVQKLHQLAAHVDRVIIKPDESATTYRIDYKTDREAARTRNLVIYEYASVVRGGETIEPGWFMSTTADWIVSYVPGLARVFFSDVKRARELYEEVRRAKGGGKFTTTPRGRDGQPYQTWFYPVSIAWLRRQKVIVRELPLDQPEPLDLWLP